MISEQQVRQITLFFLLSLLDERAAVQAAERVIADVKPALHDLEPDDARLKITIIRSCLGQWRRTRREQKPGPSRQLSFESGWRLPDGLDPAPWARFHKDATEEELIALLLSQILGFDDETIADAMGVTEGTVRYRVGKAVRQLGAAARAGV